MTPYSQNAYPMFNSIPQNNSCPGKDSADQCNNREDGLAPKVSDFAALGGVQSGQNNTQSEVWRLIDQNYSEMIRL